MTPSTSENELPKETPPLLRFLFCMNHMLVPSYHLGLCPKKGNL